MTQFKVQTPELAAAAPVINSAAGHADGRSFTGSDRRRRKLSVVWTLKLTGEEGEAGRWRLDDSADQ